MNKDGKSTYNNLFIPDMSGPLGRAPDTRQTTPVERNSEDAPFMTAKAKYSWEDKQKELRRQKSVGASPSGAPAQSSTGDYKKDYQIRKQQRESVQRESQAKAATEKLAQQKKDEAIKTELRNQARALRRDIQNWESLRGQGTHDDQAINGQIGLLQAKLNGLPPDTQY